MNYTIDLSCNAFRQLLNEDEKKRYDDILNFFIDHRYDENNSIEKLMLDWSSQNYPAKYMQFVRQSITQQQAIYSKLDTKLRVELELLELNEKLTKLHKAAEVIAKLPQPERQHLCDQENVMTQYQAILITRLKEMN